MHDLKKLEELYEEVSIQTYEKFDIWIDHVVFTWQWWVGVGLSIIPWILWFIFRKKESTLRLLTVGFFVIFISTILDSIGVQLGFWYYTHAPLPLIPAFFPWDTTLMPVVIMGLIQFKPKLNPYLKGLLFASLTSFVGEPFFIWMELYKPVVWKSIYSFPIYFLIYMIAHWIYQGKTYHR
ncbi:CBO0543 family protein [Anaerobacillus isosaccharinicus]|uniref:DUF2878 domain-containing protein n=1 Tax=Anaerobacillus isosaccharinicus TaxID=1532552 RepID=A0A1S2ME46_9BACI|nr:CBO0543 family protein [Anaerobacillus isosaccharinicus]MBA5584946.1 hypothetical protein [Anaerobacillus isosaccharinicus]QOY36698.1 hypothetical protein AWH56_003310 [Anaerobacillus isosaccharinicus]